MLSAVKNFLKIDLPKISLPLKIFRIISIVISGFFIYSKKKIIN
jgi:hypothetical protein